MDEQSAKLKEYIDTSNYTVAVTGGGISYMYGMRRLKQHAGRAGAMQELSPRHVKKHPEEAYALFKDSFLDATFEKGPSPVHYQLAQLEKQGKLQGIVTQNMDHLHSLAGSTNVAEFMGSFADSVCMECGEEYNDINLWNNGKMPKCSKCGGYLMPICFDRMGKAGSAKTSLAMQKAQDMIGKADLLLVIGTTGFRSDEYLAKLRPSTKIVQINPGVTAFDQVADLNIKMDAEKVLDQVLNG